MKSLIIFPAKKCFILLVLAAMGSMTRAAIEPSSRDHGAHASADHSIVVTTDTAWTAISTVDWLGITSPTFGEGNSVISYSVAANDGPMRTGVIIVLFDDAAFPMVVRQAAATGGVFLRHPDGRCGFWEMDAQGTVLASQSLPDCGEWRLVAVADLDGDGITDLVWQGPAPNFHAGAFLRDAGGAIRAMIDWGPAGSRSLVAAADYTGNGRADLFWNTRDGTMEVSLLDDVGHLQATIARDRRRGWRLAAAGDLSGNGRADMLWQHLQSNRLLVEFSDGGTVRLPIALRRPQQLTIADISGNGIGDILWQTPDRRIGLALMNPGAVIRATRRWRPVGAWTLRTASGRHFPARQPADRPDTMIRIPAGAFEMGDNFGQNSPFERPVHTVFLDDFYIDPTPISWELWNTVKAWAAANGNLYFFEGGDGKAPDHPVHSVMWYDAVKWCNARSEMDGLTPVYYMDEGLSNVYRAGRHDAPRIDENANGYRLPTEAQWEKAARGGLTAHRFPWGNTINHAQANYRSLSGYDYDLAGGGYHPDFEDGLLPYTSPVDWGVPNGFGLYGVCGNVSDWVWDWFSDTYYETSPTHNPMGPETGSSDPPMRVRRGGSFREVVFARTACRDYSTPYSRFNSIGFRCVRVVP